MAFRVAGCRSEVLVYRLALESALAALAFPSAEPAYPWVGVAEYRLRLRLESSQQVPVAGCQLVRVPEFQLDRVRPPLPPEQACWLVQARW